jgi:hypothetical protein
LTDLSAKKALAKEEPWQIMLHHVNFAKKQPAPAQPDFDRMKGMLRRRPDRKCEHWSL